MKCPKCGAEIDDSSIECSECGIIVKKFLKKKPDHGPALDKAPIERAVEKKKSYFSPGVIIVMVIMGIVYYFWISNIWIFKKETPEREVVKSSTQAEVEKPKEKQEKPEKSRTSMEVGKALKKIDKLVDIVPGGAARRRMVNEAD